MLKPVPYANAFTLVGLGLYVICRVLSLIIPDLLYAVGQSWFHTLSINSVMTVTPMDISTFLLGGITFSGLIWVSAYTAASLYNNFTKKS